MTIQKEYLLICVAMLGEKEGVVSEILSTHMFAEDFQFNVYTNNPESTLVKPFEQEVTIEVDKYLAHQNRTLWCQMGFHSASGAMPFTQRPPLSRVISSATQIVNTVLPVVPDGMKEAIDLYAECYDSYGLKRVKSVRVSLAQASEDTEPSVKIDSSEPRLSDIVIYAMKYPNPSTEQISKILKALGSTKHNYDHDEMLQIIEILFFYF